MVARISLLAAGIAGDRAYPANIEVVCTDAEPAGFQINDAQSGKPIPSCDRLRVSIKGAGFVK